MMSVFMELIGCIFPSRRYKENFARYKGGVDAKVGLPAIENPEIICLRIDQSSDVKLPADCKESSDLISIKQRQFLGYSSELRNIGEQVLCKAIMELHKEDASLKSRQKSLEARLVEAKQEKDKFNELYPHYEGKRLLSPLAYYIIVTVCALGELPLNLVAFRLFGEAQFMTLLVAMVIAIIIPMIAHWIGAVLKQPYQTKIDNSILTVSVLIVLATIVSIGHVRERYLTMMGEKPDSVVTCAFFVLQLLFFGIAIFLSYASHNIKQDIRDKIAHLNVSLKAIVSKRKTLRKQKKHDVDDTWAAINILLGAYLRENIIKGGSAKSMKQKIVLEIPEELASNEIDNDGPDEFSE